MKVYFCVEVFFPLLLHLLYQFIPVVSESLSFFELFAFSLVSVVYVIPCLFCDLC